MADDPRQLDPALQADLKKMWLQRAQYVALREEHALLERFTGDWKLLASFDFGGYGPNFTAEGELKATMINGGRILQSDIDCSFSGMVMTSRILTGFDNVTQKFQSVGYLSDNNGFIVTEGDYDLEEETIKEFGEISNPMFRARHDLGLHRKLVEDNRQEIIMKVPDMEGSFFDYLHCEMERIQ